MQWTHTDHVMWLEKKVREPIALPTIYDQRKRGHTLPYLQSMKASATVPNSPGKWHGDYVIIAISL